LELAQRLEDPVPRLNKGKKVTGTTSVNQEPTLGAVRPPSPDMHVFEIDRRGESVRIWAEIEERSRELRNTQASAQENSPLDLEVLPETNNSDKSSIQPPMNSSKYKKPSVRYEDDLSVQLDESDDYNRLQELQIERTHQIKRQLSPTENLTDDQRDYYFKATNPPDLPLDTDELPKALARHTSMRLSDVLNDEVEPRDVIDETAPLLEGFREGNLTAEGKRQVRSIAFEI
jgi:hypothetical protein